MSMIEKTIFVEPRGKARPRTITRGGKTWSYTPRGTVRTENSIRDRVMELGQYFDARVPIKLEAIFYREKPKSTPKKVLLPVTKPDLDNYFKLVTDSLEKFVFANDSQITTAVMTKRFGSPPRIELKLEEDKG